MGAHLEPLDEGVLVAPLDSTLLKKFTSKVDGFTFGTNLLMVITSEVKVFMTFWFYYIRRYYLLREVA